MGLDPLAVRGSVCGACTDFHFIFYLHFSSPEPNDGTRAVVRPRLRVWRVRPLTFSNTNISVTSWSIADQMRIPRKQIAPMLCQF